MRLEIVGDGRVFDGTPKQIVMRMKSVSPGGVRLSMKEFIAANLAQLGVETEPADDASDDDVAGEFLERMIADGHARRIEADPRPSE